MTVKLQASPTVRLVVEAERPKNMGTTDWRAILPVADRNPALNMEKVMFPVTPVMLGLMILRITDWLTKEYICEIW